MNGDQPGLFADFDDSVSVDDSNFQGDDEESVAESYTYNEAPVQPNGVPPANELANVTDHGAEERYSTALSRRAEHILANAKKRLTVSKMLLLRALD
jgi:hypothetical protein